MLFFTTLDHTEGDSHIVGWDRDSVVPNREQEETFSGVVELGNDRLVWSASKEACEYIEDYLRCSGDPDTHSTRDRLVWSHRFRFKFDSGEQFEREIEALCLEEECLMHVAIELSQYVGNDLAMVCPYGQHEACDINGDYHDVATRIAAMERLIDEGIGRHTAPLSLSKAVASELLVRSWVSNVEIHQYASFCDVVEVTSFHWRNGKPPSYRLVIDPDKQAREMILEVRLYFEEGFRSELQGQQYPPDAVVRACEAIFNSEKERSNE